MAAMFEFTGGGIGLMPDPDDNPDGHVVPHSDAGLQVSEEIVNVGDEDGVATVGAEVDGAFVAEYVSDPLAPGQSDTVYISLGRFDAGPHEILVYLNPGSGRNDNETDDIDLP